MYERNLKCPKRKKKKNGKSKLSRNFRGFSFLMDFPILNQKKTATENRECVIQGIFSKNYT